MPLVWPLALALRAEPEPGAQPPRYTQRLRQGRALPHIRRHSRLNVRQHSRLNVRQRSRLNVRQRSRLNVRQRSRLNVRRRSRSKKFADNLCASTAADRRLGAVGLGLGSCRHHPPVGRLSDWLILTSNRDQTVRRRFQWWTVESASLFLSAAFATSLGSKEIYYYSSATFISSHSATIS